MRLTALALHAHAATSRFTTAPTARFSVVVARAMSELVGGDEPTTTAEERAEAATLRTTEGAAAVAPTVAGCVFAGPGRQKYVLVQAGARYFVRDLHRPKLLDERPRGVHVVRRARVASYKIARPSLHEDVLLPPGSREDAACHGRRDLRRRAFRRSQRRGLGALLSGRRGLAASADQLTHGARDDDAEAGSGCEAKARRRGVRVQREGCQAHSRRSCVCSEAASRDPAKIALSEAI